MLRLKKITLQAIKISNFKRSLPLQINLSLVIFSVVLMASCFLMSIGWNSSLLGPHDFRQTQTAISVFYLLKGGPWIDYITPILGPEWSIPYEFPLYQWMVAVLVWITQIPLDQAGRWISVSFFLLCLLPMTSILRSLRLTSDEAKWTCCLFLLCPLYLFWSRTFLIESTALFLSLCYFACVLRWNEEAQICPKQGSFILGIIFGSLAALVKVTTYLGLGYAAAMVMIYRLRQSLFHSKHRLHSNANHVKPFRSLVMNTLLIGIPLFFAIIWTKHADTLKSQSVLAGNHITSVALHQWNFGSLKQRASFDSLKIIYHRMLADIWGDRFTLITLLGLSIFAQGFRLRILASLILFATTFLTFTNLHLIHNYYQYANGVFLISASGFLIASLLRRGSAFRALGYAFFGLSIFFSLKHFKNNFSPTLINDPTEIQRALEPITKATDSHDVLIVSGSDWSSLIPYYSERRALMIPRWLTDAETRVHTSLTQMSPPFRLGGILACEGSDELPEIKRLIKNHNATIPPIRGTAGPCHFNFYAVPKQN